MSNRVVWIGLVDVMPMGDNDAIGTAKGAFVNALAIASSEIEFCELVREKLAELGFVALTFDDVEPLCKRLRSYTVSDELLALAQETREADGVSFGTFHSYAKDETLN